MGGVEEGRACCGGRRREDGGGGDYFPGFLIQEVKLAGTQAGERQGGRWVVGGWWRSGRGWYRWTVYKGQRCHWHALHLLCQLPWFSHLQERAEGRGGEEDWAVDADKLGLVAWNVLYVNKCSTVLMWSYPSSYFVMVCSNLLCFFLPWLVLSTFTS